MLVLCRTNKIDVDGSDYWLLYEVFECRYRPKVICIEANPTMPNDLICTSHHYIIYIFLKASFCPYRAELKRIGFLNYTDNNGSCSTYLRFILT